MAVKRIFVYVRVSTTRQALHDLSIPDQENQIRREAERRGWEVVEEFIEPGASAREENRPVLQEMLARALAKPAEVDAIVVHSLSRFFRDSMLFEWYSRKLEKNGVSVISITQEFGEDTTGIMARKFMSLIDEMNSIETSKHVKRTMIENARQNYWNGAVTPFGYRSVVAELRGQKQKKRLEIDPDTGETVRLIFRLYLDGDGQNGPLGIKNIVIYLNDRGYKPPNGVKFRVGLIARILRAEIYTGRAWYNRNNVRNKVERPKDEWVAIEVPAIVSEEDFRRADVQLTNRSPKVTAPRIVNSPVLLTGVARCGSCGSMLSRLTGKGGRYTYYRCSGKVRQGSCAGGKSTGISAPILDKIVLEKICDELLTPERVRHIVAEVIAKREARSSEAETSLGQLQTQRSKNLKKLQNLLDALADGIVTSSDTFKATIKTTEDDCERLSRLIAVKEAQLDTQLKPISAAEAQVLASQLRHKLATSTAPVQKRIIRSLVESVVLTADEIIITGPKSDLAEVVTGTPPTDLYQKGRI